MRPKTEAKIYEVHNRNGSVTYRVDLGKDHRGKRITKGCSTREEAEEYKKKLDEKLAQKVSALLVDSTPSIKRNNFKIS